MKKNTLASSSIHLSWTSTKFNADLVLTIKLELLVGKVTKHIYKFGANITSEMILDTNPFGEIYHNQRNCQDMRMDGI